MDLQSYQSFVQSKLSERNVLISQLQQKEEEIKDSKYYLNNLIKARWTLAEVAKLTQQKVSNHIESLVTMAIQSVYDSNFTFHCDFDIKRNKSECILSIKEKDGRNFTPKDEDGGGILDVISTALRIVLWTMQEPRSINTFVLDEPGKFLGDLIEPFGVFIKEVSRKLNIQFIIVSHDQRLKSIGDRIWNVTKRNRISTVKQEGEELIKVVRRRV